MNVLLTDDSFNDIKDIYKYLSYHDSVDSADYVINNIYEKITSLSELPNRGSHVKELICIGNHQFREIFFKPYRIIYQVIDVTVYIMVVADGRRDMATLLEKRLLGV